MTDSEIPKFTSMEAYWSLPFGSGLWGAMNVGHFVFNPITAPVVLIFTVWVVYAVNKMIYFRKESTNKFIVKNGPFVQLFLCVGLTLGLIALFEPAISGPISKVLVYPKIALSSSSYSDGYECLRWSDFYGFNISKEDIKKHPQYIDAFMCRTHRRVNNGEYENALSDYSLVDPDNHGDNAHLRFAPIQNYIELAWLLSTCPTDKVRNGAHAKEIAQKAINLYAVDVVGNSIEQLLQEREKHRNKQKYAMYDALLLQVLAAAYAEAGQFEDACKTQEKAYHILVTFEPTGLEDEKNLLMEQLESYKANKPWIGISKSIRPIYRECY